MKSILHQLRLLASKPVCVVCKCRIWGNVHHLWSSPDGEPLKQWDCCTTCIHHIIRVRELTQ